MTFSFFEYLFPFLSPFFSDFPFLSPFLRLLVQRNIPHRLRQRFVCCMYSGPCPKVISRRLAFLFPGSRLIAVYWGITYMGSSIIFEVSNRVLVCAGKAVCVGTLWLWVLLPDRACCPIYINSLLAYSILDFYLFCPFPLFQATALFLVAQDASNQVHGKREHNGGVLLC